MFLSHSYSSIKQFENCPLRYYRQRIVKDVIDDGNEASKYGERVHTAFENRLTKAEASSDIAPYESLCRAVEEIAKGGDIYIEKELVLTEELTPTGWWEPDAWLRSKLDVLVVLRDTAIVLDWKTGKRRADNFQMQLFAAQVFKHYPEVKQVKTCLVWLKTSEMDVDVFSRENTNELWASIMKRIRRIYDAYESGVWPAKPSGLCRYCPCRNDCEFIYSSKGGGYDIPKH